MTWGRARPDVGDEVLVRLRRGPKTASIPDVTPEPTKRLLAAGAHSYLTKPISVWSFIEVVDGNLQRSSEDEPVGTTDRQDPDRGRRTGERKPPRATPRGKRATTT